MRIHEHALAFAFRVRTCSALALAPRVSQMSMRWSGRTHTAFLPQSHKHREGKTVKKLYSDPHRSEGAPGLAFHGKIIARELPLVILAMLLLLLGGAQLRCSGEAISIANPIFPTTSEGFVAVMKSDRDTGPKGENHQVLLCRESSMGFQCLRKWLTMNDFQSAGLIQQASNPTFFNEVVSVWKDHFVSVIFSTDDFLEYRSPVGWQRELARARARQHAGQELQRRAATVPNATQHRTGRFDKHIERPGGRAIFGRDILLVKRCNGITFRYK